VLPGLLSLYLTGAFLTALSASLLATYFVRSWALRRGYVDVPDRARRIHSQPTPNVGGVAVAVTATAAFMAWSFLIVPGQMFRPELIAMLVGGLLMFLVGFWDDTRHLSARAKLGLQILIAGLAFAGGVRILGVAFGDIWQSQLTFALSFVVTMVWLVGTTNAFNLIDGSDGVAAGAGLFASVSMGIIFALNGDPLGALMATVLVGACLGFLFFNFPPASIFLGDSGSLFLGYSLASLGVITTQKSSTLLAIAIPVIAFAVPLLDTAIAIVRRFLRHQPIFAPDRGHIHHRLKDLGLSSRGVAALLYVACAGCASLSMLLAAPGRTTALPVFVVAGAVLIMAVARLNVPELTELSRVVGRTLQQRQVISHNVRIHTAADALYRVHDMTELVRVLDGAFRAGEFSRVQIWVPEALGAGLTDVGTNAVVTRGSGGCELSLAFEHPLRPKDQMEIRVPMYHQDTVVGRISLYRTVSGARLYTDLRLIPQRLVPALVFALKNTGGSATENESSHA
jgi:UDP-GlcNAc:undecaprenyl-phosphate GlcNAc-1-phosphate transferase